jgi:hypothetical protein
MSDALKAKPGKTPQTSTQVLSVNAITSDHIQQLLDILKQVAERTTSSSPEASPSKKNEDGTKPIIASKLKIPTVHQMYN